MVQIAGYPHAAHVSPEGSHFADINILGNDFINSYDLALGTKYRHAKVDIYFNWDTEWETPKRKLKL